MLNDFIGGGQIFLHKIRMFMQVFNKSVTVALLIAFIGSSIFVYINKDKYDWQAAGTYQKAYIANGFNEIISSIRTITNSNPTHQDARVDAYTKKGQYGRNVKAINILRNQQFKASYKELIAYLCNSLLIAGLIFISFFILIFVIWSKFGKGVKESIHLSGSVIKTAKEVASYLRKRNIASDLVVGGMPLVKDAETRHILVTGMTGSGKTNLINTILPQVRRKKQPALVIDQTGEMISRYYKPERGDIIFNPLDSRSHSWDFWTDATLGQGFNEIDTRLEKFSKVLFKTNNKYYSASDPFWENSAETIFCSCVEYLIKTNNKSINELKLMLGHLPLNELKTRLKETKAARYLASDNKNTASSILSVMATSTKPLCYLYDSEKKFSLKEYFSEVKKGSDAWLFFSTPPNQREVILPLLACLFELAISYLIEIGINQKRRMWFVVDELAALGRLNGFVNLMNEGRKYGGCVIAATQSLNQIFENFGNYIGNTIFGQFATKFLFRNDEPAMARIISEIFGQVEYKSQQKNTSFGAHEHRDGVSYTEHEKRKHLITASDLATLPDLECFIGLPEPDVRIAKIKMPPVTIIEDKNAGFIGYTDKELKEKAINKAMLNQKSLMEKDLHKKDKDDFTNGNQDISADSFNFDIEELEFEKY